MRKLIYHAAISLDGFIAGPGEALDWLRGSEDSAAILKERWKGVDTILMGRRTWEFAQRRGGGPQSARMKTYVFSHTLEAPPEGAELASGDAAAFVDSLKRKEGGGIWLMGGGELAAALIDAGLVDELGLSVHPILLGGGAPLFGPMSRRTDLDLVECRRIANNCVYLRYLRANA